MAFLDSDHDRSRLGTNREYEHSHSTLSSGDRGPGLPGRHGGEFVGRHHVLRHRLHPGAEIGLGPFADRLLRH
ncbi:MAG: hypothetical protein QOG23_4611 [Blastocatellia bacterium]|nr:hypothetical protein [Blastocatellia bacterium]